MSNALSEALSKASKAQGGHEVNVSSPTEQKQAKRAASAEKRPPVRSNTNQLCFWPSKAASKQLKMLVVEHETTQQALMLEAMNMLFAKYGRPEIADPNVG